MNHNESVKKVFFLALALLCGCKAISVTELFLKRLLHLKSKKKCDFFYKKSKQLCLNNVKCSSNMFYLFVLNKSCK